jgi:hypothetical protein
MTTKTLKTVPKISVKIWRPIIKKLDAKLEAACLRRDAYLNRVLEVELDRLDSEVSIPNSQASYNYISEKLDELDRKLVSLALPQDLTTRLNEICSRKRIVRDAFFNRLFLLLAAAPQTIDRLLFDGVGSEWRTDVWSEYKHDGQFFQNGIYPLEASIDPFWAIRAGLDMYNEGSEIEEHVDPVSGMTSRTKRVFETDSPADSLYATVFTMKVDGNDLLGLNCSLPDCLIPGHDAQKQLQRTLDEILGEL